MKALFIAQHGQEESEAFHARVNAELARLGDRIKQVQFGACLHEKTIGGRANIPSILFTVMVLYEDES